MAGCLSGWAPTTMMTCSSKEECTSNPCGDRKAKYRHNFVACEVSPTTVTCATFGYPGDGVCYDCHWQDSEFVSCC